MSWQPNVQFYIGGNSHRLVSSPSGLREHSERGDRKNLRAGRIKRVLHTCFLQADYDHFHLESEQLCPLTQDTHKSEFSNRPLWKEGTTPQAIPKDT